MKKLTKTEKKIVEMCNEGKKVFEIAMVVGKPIPIVYQILSDLLENNQIVIESVK